MRSFLTAVSTLTLFPVPSGHWTEKNTKQSVLFYPLVGAFLGGLLALLSRLHYSPSIEAVLILLLWTILTGALHLDGLADCLDGFFGGQDPQDRRRIMKEPTVGVFGICGLVLLLLSKYVFLENLMGREDCWKWLVAVPLFARWSLSLSCVLGTPPSGPKGLGSSVLGIPPYFLLITTIYTAAAGFFLVQGQALGAFAAAGALSLCVLFLSKKKIGGLTGDGLGATVELAEVSLLFLALLHSSGGFPFL